MILISDLCTKIQELLNTNTLSVRFKVGSWLEYLDAKHEETTTDGVITDTEFIPCFLGNSNGKYVAISGSGIIEQEITLSILYPVEMQDDIQVISQELCEDLAGATLSTTQTDLTSVDVLTNCSIPNFEKAENLDIESLDTEDSRMIRDSSNLYGILSLVIYFEIAPNILYGNSVIHKLGYQTETKSKFLVGTIFYPGCIITYSGLPSNMTLCTWQNPRNGTITLKTLADVTTISYTQDGEAKSVVLTTSYEFTENTCGVIDHVYGLQSGDDQDFASMSFTQPILFTVIKHSGGTNSVQSLQAEQAMDTAATKHYGEQTVGGNTLTVYYDITNTFLNDVVKMAEYDTYQNENFYYYKKIGNLEVIKKVLFDNISYSDNQGELMTITLSMKKGR